MPATVYYGAQTRRALAAFPISGWPVPARLIHALAEVKRAAIVAGNPARAAALNAAIDEIVAGQHDNQFPVDVFQDGHGAATNANLNEVIAGRAAVRPDDLGSISADDFRLAIRRAVVQALREELGLTPPGDEVPELAGYLKGLAVDYGRQAAAARSPAGESLGQVCLWVIGAETTVRAALAQGLPAWPLIGTQLLESVHLLAAGRKNLAGVRG